MRRTALIAVAALSLAACSDATSPGSPDMTLLEAGAYGTALTAIGGYDADIYQDRLANALPAELALTSEQRAKIRSLVEGFVQSTRADREALGAILHEAHLAIQAGKPRAEVEAILAKGLDIRHRLAAAEAKLKSDIDAVLTPEQRAWLAAHSPRSCRAEHFPPLTEAQKAQIHALEAGFQQNNKADIDLVRATLDEAQAAIRAGKSREEVAQILAKAAPAIIRLEAARQALRGQILGVLTPEQKASGCLPLG